VRRAHAAAPSMEEVLRDVPQEVMEKAFAPAVI